jgi:phosphatidylinositol glycan class B
LALAVSAAADYFYFGFLTFPPYQWLTFNITKGLAVFYGVNDWHYYLSQGLPLLLTTYLPFGLIALWSSTSLSSPGIPTSITNTRFQLAFTVLVTLITLSLISHKEVRFIYPLLPLLHLLLAPHVVSFFTATPLPSVLTASISSLNSNNKIPRPRRLLLILLLSLNVVISIYTTQFHQRGVLSVISYLRTEYESLHLNELGQPLVASPSDNNSLQNTDADTEIFAAFLMPCHSTPWRSHLVYPGLKAWALTCEPPINIPANSTERKAYRDEADRFYDDPKKFLEEEIGGRERPWPRFVVGFEGIESVLRRYYEEAMKGWTVRRRWEGFNSHWHDDARRVGNVVVWEFVEKEGQGKKDEEAQERIEEEKPRTRGL